MSPTWLVDRPAHLLTPAIEKAIEDLGLGRISGWAKKGTSVEFVAGLDSHPYQRTVVIGPRGGIQRDSLAEYETEKARKAAAAERRARRAERSSDLGVYDRRGNLVGLRWR